MPYLMTSGTPNYMIWGLVIIPNVVFDMALAYFIMYILEGYL